MSPESSKWPSSKSVTNMYDLGASLHAFHICDCTQLSLLCRFCCCCVVVIYFTACVPHLWLHTTRFSLVLLLLLLLCCCLGASLHVFHICDCSVNNQVFFVVVVVVVVMLLLLLSFGFGLLFSKIGHVWLFCTNHTTLFIFRIRNEVVTCTFLALLAFKYLKSCKHLRWLFIM